MKTYSHTQKGTAIFGAMLVMAAIFLIIGYCVAKPIFITAPILLVIGWLFHSLTIEIADDKLRWAFGPGLIRKCVPMAQIVSALPTKNRSSWGIHWSPRLGWLYNVSGFDAVLVTMRDGTKFALGTDEPEMLAEAIRSRIK